MRLSAKSQLLHFATALVRSFISPLLTYIAERSCGYVLDQHSRGLIDPKGLSLASLVGWLYGARCRFRIDIPAIAARASHGRPNLPYIAISTTIG
jgi:hypothetical protein